MHEHTTRRRRALLLTVAAVLVGALLGTVPSASSAPTARPTLDRQQETGKVGFIGTRPGSPVDVGLALGAKAAEVATTYLERNARRLGLAAARTDLRVVGEHHSSTGGRTVRVAQTYAGIPVLGGEFTVNLDAHRDIVSVLGEASPMGDPVTKPAVDARTAVRAAVARVARETGIGAGRLTATRPELMFYDPRLLGAPGPFRQARLSWVMEVRASSDAVAQQVVVDARKGAVALAFSTIEHARDRRVCDAGSTAAQVPCTAPVWTETTQPAGVDDDVRPAFEYAGDTYDFFADRFGRDSLDDAGLQLVSTVDYCPSPFQCPYANAFWNGSQMVYGDGFAAADDVVGHELSHGVTDFTSSLFYYMQSGAINESMSDIFGELIDQTNGAGTDTADVRWLLGEDVPGFGAIRDMADPPALNQPDRMDSPLYFGGDDDGGGVHTNSGVSNKAAYLLVDGATFNGHTVSPIGLDKTALLFYTVDNDLLVSASDFADLANAMRQACTDLAGAGTGGFTSADCVQVEQAVQATEMDLNPTNAPTEAVVAPCPTGSPTYVHRDDLEAPAGQFTTMARSGSEVWSYPQNPNDYAGFDATYATSGETNIWGDNPGAASDSALRMSTAVTIPPGAFLHFAHAYGFEDDDFGTYDGGVVEYSTSGAGGPWLDAGPFFATGEGAGGYNGAIDDRFSNPLGGRSGFVGESNGYGASRADLASLAGQNVMFRWRIGTDESLSDFGWFIDDVSILTCGDADTTPPDTTITSGPPNGSTVTTSTATFSFAATEAGSTFQCKLDSGSYASCTTPKTNTALADGSHTFSVRATDPAGNTDPTPATRTFTVATQPPPDTTPPQTGIAEHPRKKTFSRKARFAFGSSEDGSAFRCKLDRKAWRACSSPKRYNRLKPGRHTFRVRAIDEAGNTDPTPAIWRWRVRRRR